LSHDNGLRARQKGGSSGPRTVITPGRHHAWPASRLAGITPGRHHAWPASRLAGSRRTCSTRTSRRQRPTRSGAPTSPTADPRRLAVLGRCHRPVRMPGRGLGDRRPAAPRPGSRRTAQSPGHAPSNIAAQPQFPLFSHDRLETAGWRRRQMPLRHRRISRISNIMSFRRLFHLRLCALVDRSPPVDQPQGTAVEGQIIAPVCRWLIPVSADSQA
jgi:hypothetical protein